MSRLLLMHETRPICHRYFSKKALCVVARGGAPQPHGTDAGVCGLFYA